MSLPNRLPASILGGDPFSQFRFLYRRDLLWKLFDEEYCLSVMRACYEAGGRAFDLSFEVNTRLFQRLSQETGDDLVGFGNPSWEQGVFLNGRYLQLSRDRIMRTLVDRFFSKKHAQLVSEKLSREDVLVFGYDRTTQPLSDAEISNIHLDEQCFRQRLSSFQKCQYITLGGADADWLISLGRMDIVADMTRIVREMGFIPLLLCQFPSTVIPAAEASGLNVEGYVVPLNRDWSWFTRDECIKALRPVMKPIIAFMPLASGNLRQDIRGALDWLYQEIGVESILFGTATPEHARETTRIALEARLAADAVRSGVRI